LEENYLLKKNAGNLQVTTTDTFSTPPIQKQLIRSPAYL